MQQDLTFLTNKSSSAWVSASAGTGKTKILTDKVLNLLLCGVKPKNILCLTFTNAAAGEMLTRITYSLKKWSVLDNQELFDEIEKLTLVEPDANILSKAKNLYKKQIHDGQNFKIYTIHAFCQNLLRKFPSEAGISPGFKVIDEVLTKMLLVDAINEVLDEKHSLAIKLLKYVSHFSIREIIYSSCEKIFRKDSFNLDNITNDSINKILKENSDVLRSKFVISNNTQEETFSASIINETIKIIQEGLSKLSTYSDEIDFIYKLKNIELNDKHNLINNCKELFLTAQNEPRKKLLPKSISNKFPEAEQIILNMQDAYIKIYERQAAINIVEKSRVIIELSLEAIKRFTEKKINENLLDYNDLISKTYFLLNESKTRDWIHYKLDARIDHILLDEAQDTSEKQWAIISTLLEDFFSGHSAKEIDRSLFVVGDVKQSIYSFQGARPELFDIMKVKILSSFHKADKIFIDYVLGTTYRLSPPILKFVEELFITNKLTVPYNSNLLCSRTADYGYVELWPLITQENDKDYFWPLPYELSVSEHHEQLLALKIAKYIKETIDNKIVLSSKKRPAEAGDFLILIKHRSKFTNFLNKALILYNIKISGADRLVLSSQLAVKDLLAAAKFTYKDYDNLNLASLLKSPIFNINDNGLSKICDLDKGTSIYSKIKLKAQAELELINKGNLDEIEYIENTLGIKLSYIDILYQLNFIKTLSQKKSTKDFFYELVLSYNFIENYYRKNDLEAVDATYEFLEHLKSLEQNYFFNLAQVVEYILNEKIERKRELSAQSSVRIMTIHGAKGLQAPIVILADTTSVSNSKVNILDDPEDEFILWPSKEKHKFVDSLKDKSKTMELEEYYRLLYVAVTRAEDFLIITGSSTSETVSEESWYWYLKETISKLGVESTNGVYRYEFGEQVKEYLKTSTSHNINLINYNNLDDATPKLFDDRATRVIKALENPINQNVKLNDNIDNYDFNFSNKHLKIKDDKQYLGNILHKILEDVVKLKDLNLIDSHPMLNNCDNKEFLNEILLKVKIDDKFQKCLEFESKTEVNIGFISNNKSHLKRIDLLVFNGDKILIVDYKTGNKFYSEKEHNYSLQLDEYKKIIQKIYTDKKIYTALFRLKSCLWESLDQENNLEEFFLVS